MTIRTIFAMAEEGARGERSAWQEFVRDYREIAQKLLERYFAVLKPEIQGHVAAVFQRARLDDNAWFRNLQFANEREFLMAFRELVFAYGREAARVPAPEITLQQYQELTDGLPLVERQMLWLYLKGYDAAQIAPMVMNAAATAEAVKAAAQERMAQALPGALTDVFQFSRQSLIEAAEKARSEQCLPLKTFNNIVNGQISWREREVAEQHIQPCFYCVDRFTSFLEMIRYRKEGQPAPDAEVEPVLAALKLPPPRKKGLLGRLLPGSRDATPG